MNLKQAIRDLGEIMRLPEVSIDLMHSATEDNDPFYDRIVREFYDSTRKRHRKFPLVKNWRYGVALCELPASFDDYFMYIEASARRNYKKAVRIGYEFKRINFNDYRDDIKEIRQSTDVRQGKVPDEFLKSDVPECKDPPSKTDIHDYPYYGVLKDNKLYAYAGCLVAGELCMIEQIYGHADYQDDGVVPMLIVGIAGEMMKNCPKVKYYGYGSYYGAGETMRRFKRKFKFLPHKVEWKLG